MAREPGCLVRDALLQITVGNDAVHAMIRDLEVRRVKCRPKELLPNGKTDRIARALTQRSRRDLHAWCFVTFRMTRGDAAPLTKLLELLDGHFLETGEM